MAKTRGKVLGAWAFLIGVILALVIGLFSTRLGTSANSTILIILIVAGIIIGLFNISDKESQGFLFAALALIIVSFMGQGAISVLGSVGYGVGDALKGILNALLILFVPTTIIVALKLVFDIARD